jgi:hypothetical protein
MLKLAAPLRNGPKPGRRKTQESSLAARARQAATGLVMIAVLILAIQRARAWHTTAWSTR